MDGEMDPSDHDDDISYDFTIISTIRLISMMISPICQQIS